MGKMTRQTYLSNEEMGMILSWIGEGGSNNDGPPCYFRRNVDSCFY